MSNKVQYKDMSWMDVEKYLETNNRIVITIGAVEQHGYLSLLTDTLVATEVAKKVCAELGILMTPAFPFGVANAWKTNAGTMSLKPITFILVIQELIEGLYEQGFRQILMNNGHGGNTFLLGEIMMEFNNTHSDARLGYFSGYNHSIANKVVKEMGLSVEHANWAENFPFTNVGPVPEGEKKGFDYWPRAASSADFKEMMGDGVEAGPYKVSEDKLNKYFDAMVEAMKLELKCLDEVYLKNI